MRGAADPHRYPHASPFHTPRMHLQSLTIKGFKSFAEPTTFLLEPGVTCIVGPNGSGKSNVVDALAWVMGEQGAKTLRGGKMEDVIFAGTSTRGPLGRAEVTLTIDNHDGVLPIDYAEVSIRRTLFRNGGSEYAINGEAVRLLDVQELLSDTGLGREMHVIVGQGRLDSVLHATPEDRRGFIEEAAGILKHRRRKEKTVRKLEAMEQNLTRLRDLVGEVRRQLKPLGRQADVARRAQGIAAIARDAKARLVADDVVRLRDELAVADRTESERATERAVLEQQLARSQADAKELEASLRSDRADEARRVAFELESVLERLRNLAQLSGQRRALVLERANRPARETSVSAATVAEVQHEINALEERVDRAQSEWQTAREATAEGKAILDEVDQSIAAQTARMSQYDLTRSKLSGAAETAAGKLAGVRGEVLRQENARDAAQKRLDEAERHLDEVGEVSDAGEHESKGLTEAYEHAQQAAQTAERERDEVQEQLHRLERERDALEARASALTLAADSSDAGAALLLAETGMTDGQVAERLTVEPGYEAAIAAALGDLGDAIIAATPSDAFSLVERAATDDLGRVDVAAPIDERLIDPSATEAAEIAGCIPAQRLVTGPDGAMALLHRVYVAETLRDARAVLPLLPEGARIVTRDAEVLTGASVRGGSSTTGQSRIELLAERDRTNTALAAIRADIERADAVRTDRRRALASARETASTALEKLRAVDAELAGRRDAAQRASARVEAARADLERATTALEQASGRVPAAASAAEEARAALAEHEAAPRPELQPGLRDEAANALERLREQEVEARLRVETLRERIRSEEARAKQLQARFDEEREAADRDARDRVLAREELQRIEQVVEALPALISVAEGSVDEARTAFRELERERAAGNEQLQRLRENETQVRARIAAITDDVHNLELQMYERKLQVSSLIERAQSELGLTEEILIAEYGPDQPVPADDETLRDTAERAAQASAAIAALKGAFESDEDESVVEAGEDFNGGGASESERPAAARERPDPLERDYARAMRERYAANYGDETHPSSADSSEPDDQPEAAPAGVPFDRAEQEQRLAQSERMLGQLGRINPLALEEFAALEQRHAFLAEQLDDLERTRGDLMRIVGDIDERMKTVFEEAFADTRDAFHEIFPILFPGGTGDIHLTNPDDSLTTGVDVSVRPAGKKIERLSLLSGGERSLAAVAFLIAIFTARPSPFYILDEVEAALDDANLGRLLNVFERLRESSQLIIITHQKRTMEIADALYGVSMRQDGVSTVVGQRIERDDDQPASA